MNSAYGDIIEFNTLKSTILTVISNAEVVNRQYSCKDSGIYLLYVDDFDDDKIIPFYIGQTTDFRKRFLNHIRDIESIMDYSYAEYHNEFFCSSVGRKNAFEGKYRPCKIFKYLIDHGCALDDIKMVVLEKCSKDTLYEREQHYLSLYLPAFFGFNQIPTITEQFVYRNDSAKRKMYIQNDFRNFKLYIEYGYSAFNYLHAFSGYGDEELNQRVNKLTSNHSWPTSEESLTKANYALDNYQKIFKKAYFAISELVADQLHTIFEKCKLKSKGREEDVIKAFTNHFRTPVVDIVNNNLDYLDYYFNRDKKSRMCGDLIKELYNEKAKAIEPIIKPVHSAFEQYANSRMQAVEQSRFSLIFPRKPFGDSVSFL